MSLVCRGILAQVLGERRRVGVQVSLTSVRIEALRGRLAKESPTNTGRCFTHFCRDLLEPMEGKSKSDDVSTVESCPLEWRPRGEGTHKGHPYKRSFGWQLPPQMSRTGGITANGW